ncbi:hypothetical protein EDI_026540 [Entamoeba dispar SAW760]|uniref:Ribosomal protein L1 n=1 Tax=Entamoeba dispar (strain ATCC PRA-260 / SAW760) TaxID=370354 RepID=B0EPV3_ENTDS|nr:uncharacterized protein EDI_026540 [Entamoeba dispar SAW760]EDR23422.1 hypothetical protein EDI_026540 [Entamoeba dispar SAW760]|eukprot:EDR23422.1 hypothetical protein EDI_026540 [Entamoeba dispar SAW760]
MTPALLRLKRVTCVIKPIEDTKNNNVNEKSKKTEATKPKKTLTENNQQVVSDIVLKKYKPIERAHILKTIRAIKQYNDYETKNSSITSLFNTDKQLQITFDILKEPRYNPHIDLLTVPHPFYNERTVCLICANPKSYMKEKVAKTGVHIDKIISTKQIRERYSTFEAQDELMKRYDVFLVEIRVCHLLSVLFNGRIRSNNIFIPVFCGEHSIKEQVEKATKSIPFTPLRLCDLSLPFGVLSQSDDDLADNFIALTKQASECIYEGSDNITQIQVKVKGGSIGFPVFQAY